ncbi:MAG: anti-sigma factor antagonist [Desulfovibrio sp.]|nr:MAG: anti-sigma factor antagonist [Desulfovibrio sp.]
MILSYAKEGDVMRLTISGKVEEKAHNDELHELVEQWIGQKEKLFIIDLSDCRYCNSATLREFLILGKTAKAMNGKLHFVGVKAMLLEIFELSNFQAIFPIFDTMQEAVDSM